MAEVEGKGPGMLCQTFGSMLVIKVDSGVTQRTKMLCHYSFALEIFPSQGGGIIVCLFLTKLIFATYLLFANKLLCHQGCFLSQRLC